MLQLYPVEGSNFPREEAHQHRQSAIQPLRRHFDSSSITATFTGAHSAARFTSIYRQYSMNIAGVNEAHQHPTLFLWNNKAAVHLV